MKQRCPHPHPHPHPHHPSSRGRGQATGPERLRRTAHPRGGADPLSRRRALVLIAAGAASGLALSGCWDDDTGPTRLLYDRDTCDLCRMMISDRRFAAQLRDPQGQPHRFDDIGCALNWLHLQSYATNPAVPIWVNDYQTPETWLVARDAQFLRGFLSPMNYGFAALATSHPDAISFAAMRQTVLELGQLECHPSQSAESPL